MPGTGNRLEDQLRGCIQAFARVGKRTNRTNGTPTQVDRWSATGGIGRRWLVPGSSHALDAKKKPLKSY